MSETPEVEGRRPWLVPLVIVSVLALVLAGFGGYAAGLARNAPPAEDSADVGFLRDMYEHHSQAVEMSLIFREKSENPTLRAIAYDIATSQGNQMGQMEGMLRVWDWRLTRDGEPMQWMMAGGHDHGSGASTRPMIQDNGLMDGMASPEQMQQLRDATGTEAERLFLTLMITHHKAGIEMAKAGSELADTDFVKDLATKMYNGQTSETELLESELAKLP
ncbi:DUF305 domain-containing protein [Propionibacteriaceae bacterium Y1923]